MYVIYPADELINLLLSREYNSNSTATTPSAFPRSRSRSSSFRLSAQSLSELSISASLSQPPTPQFAASRAQIFNFNQHPPNRRESNLNQNQNQNQNQNNNNYQQASSQPKSNFYSNSSPSYTTPTAQPQHSYHFLNFNESPSTGSRRFEFPQPQTTPYKTVPGPVSDDTASQNSVKSQLLVKLASATPEPKTKTSFFSKLKKFRHSFTSKKNPPSSNLNISKNTTAGSICDTNRIQVKDEKPQLQPCPAAKGPVPVPIKPERIKSKSKSKSNVAKEKVKNLNLNLNSDFPPEVPLPPTRGRLSNPFRKDKVHVTNAANDTVHGYGSLEITKTRKNKGKNLQNLNLNLDEAPATFLEQYQQQQQDRLQRRGRSATPTITVTTPAVGFSQFEDATFTNYRGRNTSGGQRLVLTSSESPSGQEGQGQGHSQGPVQGRGLGQGQGQGQFQRRALSSSPKPRLKFVFPATTDCAGPNEFSRGNLSASNSISQINYNYNTVPGSSKNKMIASNLHGGGGGSGTNIMADPNSLKDLVHPSLNETLKSHNALTFKLIRIVSDFTQQLSQLQEQHAVELQLLVDNFRKRNAELRKERPPCSSSLFQVWETLLQEVEIDSQAHSDLSGSLGRQVARPLLEKTFCRKIQSRKIFAHRESFETVLNKTEALLSTTYRDYCDACLAHIQQGNSTTLASYFDAHNAYVQQLRGTNAMLKEYHQETLPALLQELDEIYIDLCNTLSESILHGADLISSRTQETNRRYETLSNVCRNMSGNQDLRDLVKSMTVPLAPNQRHAFTTPAPLLPSNDPNELSLSDKSHVPVLKDEIIMDRLSAPATRTRMDTFRKEMTELESEMKQLQDSLDTLSRMQQRSLDSNLFNKANELQEEISMKRFDLRVAQMHLAALRAQTRTDNSSKGDGSGDPSGVGGGGGNFGDRVGNSGGGSGGAVNNSSSQQEKYIRERKMSVNSNATMKSKWMKAFRSLKTPQTPSPSKEEKKNGKEKDKAQQGEGFQIFENHIFQEYTYKKITPCDICSQVLRGHTKQGLRCRLCKLNIHLDCQEKVNKCLPKTRLLRRQRSTSELETKLTQMANEQATSGAEDESTRTGGGGDSGVGGSVSSRDGRSAAAANNPNQDEPDLIYQVLKQATDIKKTTGGGAAGGGGGSGSSGSGSGNGGIHGSSQTLYSQHDVGGMMSGMGGASVSARRSNPSVNVVGQSGTGGSGGPSTSGSTTPGAMGAAQALANQSSSSGRGLLTPDSRRNSFLSHKSISAEPGNGSSSPFFLLAPPPTSRSRCISLPESPQTPHSPRRRKLDLRMKSFSLDSPESTEHAQRRRYAHGSHSTSHSQSPSSPVHNRRALLSARNVRMSSVELPDENDKSLSSASTSPCPSPKPHRLLPTNLYVVLYMFKARHPDELDLKAGYKVTVTDTTDPDWWQGKCMGRIGYFPSKYVTKLQPGEKPLQVTHNLQVTDGAENGLKLLRDQIVIQVGEELDGMVTIRNGDNKQGICPIKYLQEV